MSEDDELVHISYADHPDGTKIVLVGIPRKAFETTLRKTDRSLGQIYDLEGLPVRLILFSVEEGRECQLE